MARRSIIIAAVVLVLGLVSVGAGFAAEFTRVKGCNPVMGLCITAAVAMFLLRVVVRVATGRGYACCRTLPSVPKVIRYCIILAWLMSFAAIGQFIAGVKLCNQCDTEETYECNAIKPGYFSTAALEALVSLCLTLFYYLVIASSQNTKPPVSELEAPPVANVDPIRPSPQQMSYTDFTSVDELVTLHPQMS